MEVLTMNAFDTDVVNSVPPELSGIRSDSEVSVAEAHPILSSSCVCCSHAPDTILPSLGEMFELPFELVDPATFDHTIRHRAPEPNQSVDMLSVAAASEAAGTMQAMSVAGKIALVLL